MRAVSTAHVEHQAPGAPGASFGVNVLPDLATAMKFNPRLKVMLNGGYFDLATPFFAARYEMYHLPIPANLRQNLEYSWYESGHMVYVGDAASRTFAADLREFIRH